MAKEDGFLGLFQKLQSDPTAVMLGAEQIDALIKKLHGTQMGRALPTRARGWRGRLFLQMGGAVPTFRIIEKIRSTPKPGIPLAYDATFTFDGKLISENYPFITRDVSDKTRGFNAATNKIFGEKIPVINTKQRS